MSESNEPKDGSKTKEAIETILKGEAALGKGPWAPTKPTKMEPGVTATEQGMRAVLAAEEAAGKKIR